MTKVFVYVENGKLSVEIEYPDTIVTHYGNRFILEIDDDGHITKAEVLSVIVDGDVLGAIRPREGD